MSYSANEITALAQKAARGAGFPPGQAELFGRAAARHLGTGGAPEALTDALANPQDSPILRLPLMLDDIPRALKATGPDICLTLQPGDEGLAESYAQLLPVAYDSCTVRMVEGLPRIALTQAPDGTAPAALPPRIPASDPLVAALTALAARTYVPASEASRSAGAGAGDIDND
ncbi:DUF3726 domain-containing protein [Antarctobacter jejuensis]|uniref:DUF3726 domain-containing protein n=1 Tax=Antarctobacter jejuensis TaxID=1439938 RepID=UPI003FD52D70